MTKDAYIHARVPQQLASLAEERAVIEDRSVSQIVRHALVQYVELTAQRRKSPSKNDDSQNAF